MQNSLVSIIVPIYKVEQYLNECVDSILSQTYKNIEVILVDDGSPDGSPAICDEYAKQDSRIKVIHKSNGGLSDARNAGLDIASGDYISFCDSDDKIDPNMIETLLYLLREHNADVVSCESCFWENGKESIIKHYHKNEKITKYTGIEYIRGFFDISTDCSVCNKIYKKTILEKFRFEVGKTNEDLLFQYNVLQKCKIIILCNQTFYKYRVNLNSITHTFNKNSLNLLYNAIYLRNDILKNHVELINDINKYLLNICYGLGRKIQKSTIKNQKEINDAFMIIKHELKGQIFTTLLVDCIKNFRLIQWIKYWFVILGN